MANVKTHIYAVGRCLLAYFMTAVLAWAAVPLIIILPSGYVEPDTAMTVYSAVVTAIMLIITYILLHGVGEKDRKPYNWARYQAKGLVAAAIAYVLITAIGWLVIWLANKYVVVHHPKFVIETLNGYLRLAVYMPFYWLLRLIEGPVREICPVPSVTYLRAALVGLLTVPPAAFGYWMGFNNHRIFKGEISNKTLRRILYQEPKDAGKSREKSDKTNTDRMDKKQ